MCFLMNLVVFELWRPARRKLPENLFSIFILQRDAFDSSVKSFLSCWEQEEDETIRNFLVVIIIIAERNKFPQNGIIVKTPSSIALSGRAGKNCLCGGRLKFSPTFLCCCTLWTKTKNIKCRLRYRISITIIAIQQTTRVTFFSLNQLF